MRLIRYAFIRRISLASQTPPSSAGTGSGSALDRWPGWTRVEGWLTRYEEFIGIKQVKEAHARVLQAETSFVEAQEERRTAQTSMNAMQVRLREVRADLDRTPRGDDNYLDLIKREIELIREERTLRDKFEHEEKRERELFNGLSNALRFSHEKERAQTEKTKYWSIMASLVGALIGIFGTTINSQIKLRQLRQLMLENTEASAAAVLLKLEQVTNGLPESSASSTSTLLTQVENLRNDLKERAATGSSVQTSARLAPEDLETLLLTQQEQRRTELLVATFSILILVPFLILKFSPAS